MIGNNFERIEDSTRAEDEMIHIDIDKMNGGEPIGTRQ